MQTIQKSMHAQKRNPPTGCKICTVRGKKTKSAFQKSADILLWYFHRIMTVEACTTDRQVTDHVLELFDRHVAQGVRSDLLADFLGGMGACDQLLVGRHIGSKIAWIQERRGTDTDMNLGRTGFSQHRNQIRNRCSADNGIVNEDNSFSFYDGFQNTQLDFYAGFPFLLCRFDKGTADIAVFVEGKTERNAGFFGIALCGGKSGVRNAADKICVNRIGLCKRCAAADSGFIDTDVVYFAVEAGKINIFKL